MSHCTNIINVFFIENVLLHRDTNPEFFKLCYGIQQSCSTFFIFAFWNLPGIVSFPKKKAVGVLHVTFLKQTGTVGEILQLKLTEHIKTAHGKQQMQDFSTTLCYYTAAKQNFSMCIHKTQGHPHLVLQSRKTDALAKRAHSRLGTYWCFPKHLMYLVWLWCSAFQMFC